MFISNRLFRNSLYLVIFILLNSADCSKPGSEPTCYISEEFKSYVIFNDGSYWVYQDQSGNWDTVKIIKTEHTIIDNPYTSPRERYNITTGSTIYGERKYIAQCEHVYRIGCDNFSKYSTNYYSPILFFCCCEEGINYENLKYLQQLDSMVVNSSIFYNIKEFESDSINPQTARKLYYSQKIGLIMYEDFEGNNWHLVDYSVFNIY